VNFPNLLTLLRILLVPLAIWLIISDELAAAFLVLVLAGITDAADGLIAKRFGWETELGAYLDPLADKLLLVSVYVVLGIHAALPSWLVIMVVSRDVMIVAGILLAAILSHPLKVKPFVVSKINTGAQIALALLVLADEGFHLGLSQLRTFGIYLTAALTAASAAAYLWAWLLHMTGNGESPPARS
jgi:cardiolipin synthase (CMP-forming)